MKKDTKEDGFYISSPEMCNETLYAEGAFKELVEDFLGRKDILFVATGVDFLAVGVERDGFVTADFLTNTDSLIDKLKIITESIEVREFENKCITAIDFGDVAFTYSPSGAYLGIPYQIMKILFDYSECW